MTIWHWLVAAWFSWRVGMWPMIAIGAYVAMPKDRWTSSGRERFRHFWIDTGAEALLLVILIFAGFFA